MLENGDVGLALRHNDSTRVRTKQINFHSMRSTRPTRHLARIYSLSQVTRIFTQRSFHVLCPICASHEDVKNPRQRVQAEKNKHSTAEGATPESSSQHLYALDPSSPGSPLFQPFGTHILLKLQAFLRAQYPTYGIQEVLTPTIYKKSLWDVSGHWESYKDDMFSVAGRRRGAYHRDREQVPPDADRQQQEEEDEEEQFGLKPMNCPGHCLLFKSQRRSYKDLPVRYADFSPLHRNEPSGSLSGLTRLRRFHQDDGHIFCRPSQVGEEIEKTLRFVQSVYETCDLGNYELRLGTRPAHEYIGDIEEWDRAEGHLKEALARNGKDYSINTGDGAFYGPKIDIVLEDRSGKKHQTATIQLDFQLPKRFGLVYDAPAPEGGGASDAAPADAEKRDVYQATPVLIHRAILGSLERFFALLIEKHHPKWPFWLNKRQLIILSVGSDQRVRDAAEEMAKALRTSNDTDGPRTLGEEQFAVDYDITDDSISKKIVNARKHGYCMFGVFGKKNMQDGTVDVSLASLPNNRKVLDAIGVIKLAPEVPIQRDEFQTVKLDKAQCRAAMIRLTNAFL
ncbi:MAG: hypothetical protein LQ351_001112 [Letrouitia transgressa]|nr:MAG: hypothetical protein LQ351_001112 [Letrouitia transgressa]